jgi:hypothetical protein
MADLVTLVLPLGQVTWSYPISHGTDFYQPYRADPNDTDPNAQWLVDVPRHVAKHLLHIGGFSVAEAHVHVLHSAGSIRLIHRDGAASCGWQGMKFEPEADGAVTVPVEALAELQSHGFVVAPAEVRKASAPQPAMLGPIPAIAHEVAPGITVVTPVAQATDTTGHVWTADPEGTAHPDGVAPAEAKAPPAPPAIDAAPAKKKA